MKDRVVCIKGSMWISSQDTKYPNPVKGEIYTSIPAKIEGYICLLEFGTEECYLARHFRPVDLSYGPAICETIEQQIELEKVLI